MNRVPSLVLVTVLTAVGAAACTRSEAAAPVVAAPVAAAAPAAAPQPSSPLPRLVFFMNPNGSPCQAQDQILRGMTAQLAGRVQVLYVKTTDPAAGPWFEHYGIRGIPSLVLTDAAGNELRRATPGIQSARQVLALVGP